MPSGRNSATCFIASLATWHCTNNRAAAYDQLRRPSRPLRSTPAAAAIDAQHAALDLVGGAGRRAVKSALADETEIETPWD